MRIGGYAILDACDFRDKEKLEERYNYRPLGRARAFQSGAVEELGNVMLAEERGEGFSRA